MTPEEIVAKLNNPPSEDIWNEVIYKLDGYDADATNLIDPSMASDRFVAAGVTYRYEASLRRWVWLP